MLIVMEQSEKEELKTELRQIVGVAMECFKGQAALIAEQYGDLVSRMDGMDAKIDSYGGKVDLLSIEMGLLRRDIKVVKGDTASIKTDLRGKAV